MNAQTVFEKVADCISEIVPLQEINQGSLLEEDLGLDCLSLVTLIISLERCFDITFDDADLNPALLVTVKNLVSLVEKYL